jgi:two-component system cell cycle sensor histidine kinase/response regulator CckA
MVPRPVPRRNGAAAISNTVATSPEGNSLAASEIRFRRLFEAAQDGILMLDAETGKITAANPFLARLLGYADAELLGKKLWEIGPFADVRKGKVAFKELQRHEYIRYDDLPLETKDGRPIEVEFVSNIYWSGESRVIQCNIRDITERNAGRRATRASDERYRALFDYAPDGIIIADKDGRYLDANASMCRLLGYTRDELVGLTSEDIVTADEVQYVANALVLITGKAEYRREWQFRKKDGSEVRADVMATAMPDGSLLAIVRDVTARIEAQSALRSSEARTRFALGHAHVGIWDMDYETGILQWSNEMEAQYGLQPGTFAGTFEAFVEHVHPEDRASMLTTVENGVNTGSDFTILHRIVRPDGAIRWLSGSGRGILDHTGRPSRAVGVSQDVTERHSLEAQFQQSQRMEAIGRLAGGVAHDFNNLLTVILGFCEMIIASGSTDDRLKSDLLQIQAAGLRAADLTRQLLAFSRKEIIEPTLLDVSAILTEMEPMLARLIQENVRISCCGEAGLSRIKADRGQIEQVILNLAVNAQAAMPDGGTLTIEAANIVLDHRYAATHIDVEPGPYVVLRVIDSGTGMTADVRQHMFEPFFTTKATGKGTGLGLATVHGIVTRSGGSITVESAVPKGTSFRVYFPEAAPAGTPIDPPRGLTAPKLGCEHVLVVEDDDAVRELARRLLVKQGYAVVVATDGEDALRAFHENPTIDLLLTDVVMPGYSGPQLAQELTRLRPPLKVIYMSGHNEESMVHHGVLNPGIAFLHKPFTSAGLGQKIRAVLDAP